MAIERAKNPKQKTVMLINDVPVKTEISLEEKFSASSNLNLLTSLRTGRVNVFNKTMVDNWKGILSTDIYTTYLDYTYFGEPELEKNYDFNQEIRKRKDLNLVIPAEDTSYLIKGEPEVGQDLELIQFHKIEHQKDVYISHRLFLELTALLREIELVQPKLIIVTGKWSLFFLTGCTTLVQTAGNAKDRKPLGGLVKFRSSVMQPNEVFGIKDTILVPIYHTVNASGMPDKVPIMELDIQKIGAMYHKIKEVGTSYYIKPPKEYILGTDINVVLLYLNLLKQKLDKKRTLLSCDVETFFHSLIDCIGITDSIDTGLCIPFATLGNPHYWSVEDEIKIMSALKEVMEHPNALHVGQNYSYDCQCYHKLWCFKIKATLDPMVMHHILYNYLPKDLAFLASLYCEFYSYWKDDVKATKDSPETRWIYNIKDICYTLEIALILIEMIEGIGGKLEDLYSFQQDKVSPALDKTMNRGVRVDKDRKEELYVFFHSLMQDICDKINGVLGMEFNQNSTPQKRKLFSDFFGMTLKTKKGGNETCDASAMLSYIEEYPLYRPLLTLMLEYASLKVFVNNFLGMKLDDDDRARTAYGIASTGTGRLNSKKNIWGKGGNFQNIPEKGKINLKVALEVIDDMEVGDSDYSADLYAEVAVEGSIILPNVKKIFLFDEGKEGADADYSGADAMVVASDSECKWLLDFFSKPQNKKLYAYVASEHLQRDITDKSPEYKAYKAVCHGTNYGLGLEKLASMLRISYEYAKDLQDFYFLLNPEIKKWHERIRLSISRKGYIENIFGRRGWFLNRNDPTLFNKAYAFIPQSTIADLVNHAMVNIVERHPEIDVLMQVHDSLVLQYDIAIAEQSRINIINCMEFDLPYAPPLRIPADLKVSTVSYGDTKKPEKLIVARDYKIMENKQLEKLNG